MSNGFKNRETRSSLKPKDNRLSRTTTDPKAVQPGDRTFTAVFTATYRATSGRIYGLLNSIKDELTDFRIEVFRETALGNVMCGFSSRHNNPINPRIQILRISPAPYCESKN
jgi:hypothetical protein